jgi:hypothetical protein
MKVIVFITFLFVSSCSSIPTCGTKSVKIQIPSTVPFFAEPFVIERSNDHVDCALDPDERNTND